MNFTYETQGTITYLVCELEPAEQMDSLALGMLTNNHIAGLAPVLYTEMNGQRFLKYNISAKVTAEQFFSGTMSKQRALTAFQNILNAVCSADDYMIDPNCFSVASEHIFINVSSCETALLCIPTVNDKDINTEVASFFKKIMFSTQFDNSEDTSYIAQLITYINSGAEFNIYRMKELVAKLQAGVPTGIPSPQSTPASQTPSPVATAQRSVNAAPVSSFDSTITMDEMSAIMAQRQAQQPLQVSQVPQMQQPNVQPVVQRPATPVMSSVPPAKPVQAPTRPPMPAASRPMNNMPVPPQQGRPMQAPQKPQQSTMPQAPVQNRPNFAIPGQSPAGVKAPVQSAPVQKQQPNAGVQGEKKMSFFGLLSHYNKENVAIYKKQKEEAKAKKAAATAAQKSAQSPMNNAPAHQNVNQRPPMGVPGVLHQQYAQPQYRPPVQPMPVQNSFNETTVLSSAMMGGETTVLNANPMAPDPCLARIKTGERISINKPVFRIGKEKSYVDYFIADNTAISRSHANIHTENGEYFIEDTNSTNHTYINGKLINSNIKTKLTNGDKVRLANEDFIFTV